MGDAPDIVFQDEKDGKWYFWDETWSNAHGPYESKDEADEKLNEYCEVELGCYPMSMPIEEKLPKFVKNQLDRALQSHLGGAEFIKFEDGVLSIRLTGTCKGCPGRRKTLLEQIKPFTLSNFPEVKDVVVGD